MGGIGDLFYRLGALLTAPFRWLSYLPTWFISAPGRLFGLSLPARAGCLVAVLLIVCTVTAVLVVVYNTEEAADVWVKVKDPAFLVATVLMVAIPIVVYYWLKVWLEGEPSRYPDIDAAWKEGLSAIREHGLDLGNLPLFVVLGAPDEELARCVFAASSLEFRVQDLPHGRAPLRWYVGDKAAFLVCLDTSLLSKVHHEASRTKTWGDAAPSSSEGLRGTIEVSRQGIRGTEVSLGPTQKPLVSSPGDEPESSEQSDLLRGTMVPSMGRTLAAPGAGGHAAAPVSGALTKHEAENQKDRLNYVCELLRRDRAPACPLNGVLLLLPLENLQNVMVAREMPAAIKSDLNVLREGTQVLAPVTALVTGMERESGFCELVRRVGRDSGKKGRFGKGHTVGNPPTEETMDAFSSHACGAFEDWVYSLFRERDGLNKPGNAKLYTLLCKIRGHVFERLRLILTHGIGFDPSDKRATVEPVLFNGCYFAATGETEDRQAFVRSVIEKMLELEDDVEWTSEALAEEERYQRLAQAVMFFDGVLILALIVVFVVRSFWWK